MAAADRPFVVVGVDGSAASRDALRWAADYAALVGAELRPVAAWQWPVSMVVDLPTPEDFNPIAETQRNLADLVREVLGPEPAVDVTTDVTSGSPARVLLDHADGAALLVVGSRGHGGFAGLLLGSTSEPCARHAPCPVVVVRHQQSA
jgi:nucleotide-binding universal stress UspA family protein